MTGQLGLEWGPAGARAAIESATTGNAASDPDATNLAAIAPIAIVVDVLSFSTTVTVAADRNAVVLPFPWADRGGAAALARGVGASLAGPRSGDGVSLSPLSVRRAAGLDALVLPSPNGGSISFTLARAGFEVWAGCLRNASAVAAALRRHLTSEPGRPVTVIAAGERWPDGSLRAPPWRICSAPGRSSRLSRLIPAPRSTSARTLGPPLARSPRSTATWLGPWPVVSADGS